jgi:hypothetical protein
MFTSALLSVLVCGATRVAGAQKCGQPFEVPAGTPSKDIARTVVDQMFDEIALTDAQQAKAVDIVTKFIDDQANIARDAADRQRQVDALMKQRDADLLALLTNDADKAKLSACFKKIEGARGGGRGAPRS